MNVRQRKRWIVASAALVCLAALSLLGWGLFTPVSIAPAESAPPPNANQQNTTKSNAVEPSLNQSPSLDLAELNRLSSMDLRLPLYDPENPKAKQTANPAAAPTFNALSIRLIGTAREPGHAMAMLQKSDKTIAWCAEGQTIKDRGGELILARVESGKVQVVYRGKEYTLAMPPRPPLPGVRKP